MLIPLIDGISYFLGDPVFVINQDFIPKVERNCVFS